MSTTLFNGNSILGQEILVFAECSPTFTGNTQFTQKMKLITPAHYRNQASPSQVGVKSTPKMSHTKQIIPTSTRITILKSAFTVDFPIIINTVVASFLNKLEVEI